MGTVSRRVHLRAIRVLDVSIALVVGLALLPLLIVLGLLIRSFSEGPGMFRQQRVGRCEATFTCHKLRTMFQDTPCLGTHEVRASSVTPLGRVLRRFKIDELPQLWNVLRGQMSLVGPRPCLPSQTVLVAERRKRGVYSVRPGITGPAQVAGVDMSMPRELAELDAAWARRPSVRKYFRYIFLTLSGRGRGDRVRQRGPGRGR